MFLHILMLILYILVFSISCFFVFNAFSHPDSFEDQLLQSYGRIALFSMMTIDQTILLYIFA